MKFQEKGQGGKGIWFPLVVYVVNSESEIFVGYEFPLQGGVCAFKCYLCAVYYCSFGFHIVL